VKTPSNERLKRRQRKRLLWILVAGVALAVLLFLAILLRGALEPQAESEPIISAQASQGEQIGTLPPSFRQINEFQENGQSRLRVAGEAEAGAVIVISNRGQRLRQVLADEAGQWGLTLNADPQPMVLEAQLYTKEDAPSIRSEEAIFRLPVPKGEDVATANFTTPALIMVTAPGSPTRIIQSPFGGAPTSGPLTLSVIDYDDAGGVIITGTSAVAGRVRLYAQDNVIGETGVSDNGRWNYIAGRMLPRGEWEIRVELIPANNVSGALDERVSVSVPFALLPPLRPQEDDSGAMSINFEPLYWQVRRSLIGGGGQSTVVFAPQVAQSSFIIPQ